MNKERFIYWVSENIRLILMGQLLCLIGICIASAIAIEQFWVYLIVCGLATVLLSLSVSIVVTIMILPSCSEGMDNKPPSKRID